MKKIYLAAPYSHDEESVIEWRVEQVDKKAAELMEEGHIVFSPISHSHGINRYIKQSNNNHNFWLAQDLPFFEFCTDFYEYRLPGWSLSKGLWAERLRAIEKLGLKHTEVIPIELD